jgi:hypothetical protein
MRGSAAITQLRAHEKQTGARRRAVIVSCTGNTLTLGLTPTLSLTPALILTPTLTLGLNPTLSLTPTLTLPLTLTLTLAGNAHNSIVDLQNAGADLIWGKPMPNFTNGEMQLQLAPYLSASRTRQRMLP